MFDIFKKYLTDKITLTEEELALIASVSHIKHLRKRQYLLQEGDVWQLHAFVCKGFLRTYSVDNKGQEHIMTFAPEYHWAGDRSSLTSGLPSKFNIEALEESDILLIKKQDFEMLCTAIPAFNDLINNILQRSFVVNQDRIHANITYTAEEKYQDFVSKFPAIANRVPQHMIASYLGISPETLSRVRKPGTSK
ncbi:Crp/Fnr family transcriptional regulator [Dyadobacter luticola]|uniref:Crp/Fnr family transcriptional regulator n=1 Tax=Dyadobacter luticola TaxID=1979387 RepID=A0A5R9L2J8_9BACT|nr:Crp/Fnr family transcriptional regulator [Dyadobacter luticola]TLV02786.1 Crp/Fnr family transcriptional regulator [Dyadobacter luticola]